MKQIYIILGFLSLSLGTLGIFLPILPTTPFLLLSAFLFARGSERWSNWLLNHRVFGEYIRNFKEEKSIPLQVKLSSIGLMWGTILVSAFVFLKHHLLIQILLLLISVAVTIHILSFKTKK